MTYELWDLVGHNLIEDATSPEPLFVTVRATVEEDGPAVIDEIGFRVLDADGRTVEKLSGAALIARAQERVHA